MIALLAALAILPTVPPAQAPADALFDDGVPAFRTFTTAAGLPESTAQALAIDGAGHLWVGTQEGVANLLARAFQPLLPPWPKVSRFVNAVLPASDGSLWIGTTGSGVLRFHQGAWSRFDETSGLPSAHVYALAESGSSILVGTGGGLARWQGGRFTIDALEPFANPSVKVLLPAADGGLWIGTESGLLRQGPAGRAVYDERSGLPDKRIRSLLAQADELWIGTEAGLAVLRGGRISTAEGAGLPRAPVTALAKTPGGGGTLWAGTSGGGLAQRRAGTWRSFGKREGLPDAHVLSLLADERGGRSTLWVGTGGGLSRLVEGGFVSFPQGPQFLRDKTTSLLEIPAGGARGFWLAGEAGLQRFENGAWTFEPLEGGDLPYALAADGEGALLVGSQGGNLYRFSGGKLERLPFPASPNNTVRAILEVRPPSGPAELWVARRSGLLHRREGQWEEIDRERAGFSSPWFMSLAASAEAGGGKRVWAGGYGGLAGLHGSRWQHFSARTGLPHDAVASLFAVDQPGARALWVGTGGGGAVRIDLERPEGAPWTTFSDSSKPALQNGVIEQIRTDLAGRIYLFTNRGVARLTSSAAGWALESFAAEDGLPSEECLFGVAAADSQGRIWAGTSGGVAALAPSLPRARISAPPALVIERAAVRGQSQALADGAALSHRENALGFEYALLGYFRDEETRYRSQLIGLEAEPTDWTADGKREFPTLPAGDYQFHVWARDYAGRVVGPVARRFSIARAPWVSLWAFLLYAGVVAGAAVGVFRLRTRALRHRARMLEEKVEQRTRELAEKNQDLSAANAELLASYQQADRIFAALAQALPGKTLDDKYKLEEKIGEGAFGAVFRGRDLGRGVPVAVKVFRPQQGNESVGALERFRREGTSALRLDHPNAVAVHDSGITADGIAYLVMELLAGHSLKDEIHQSRKLPAARAVHISAQVLDALAEAHRVGMIHRDVKPDNVFLHRESGREIVKVVDFGLAKLRSAPARDQSLTVSGVVVGTPLYMAPERLEDLAYDGGSDVYSVGVMLYEMLVGRPPFESKEGNLWSLLMRQMTRPPEPPTALDPSVPPAVSAIVLRALSKESVLRPSAAQMAEELRRACPEADSPA